MQRFTEIIGSIVLSAHNCEKVGTIVNIQINKKTNRLQYFIIADVEEENSYILEPSRIFAYQDCLIIRNKSALNVTVEPQPLNLINLNAFGLSGKFLGRITDIIFNEKWQIETIATTTHELKLTNFISANTTVALFNDMSKKYSNATFKPHPKMRTEESRINVEALNVLPPLAEDGLVSTPRTIIARLPKNFREPKY